MHALFRPVRRLKPAFAAALVATLVGCASQASMAARYDQSLQRWKGASRADLVAAWGPPLLARTDADVETLTWTVNEDIRNTQGLPAYMTPSNGAARVAMPSVAPVVPVRCTTHFQLRRGVVVAWRFDGLACGAPA